MKNRGCQRCIRASLGQYRNEVLWFAGPARCDHRNARGADNRSRQLAVKASLHTVGIHGSEQNLSCSEGLASLRPFDGIDSLILPAALGIHIPAARPRAARINREYDRLRAKLLAQLPDQLRTAHRGRVDADFISARDRKSTRLRHGTNSAAY